MQPQGFVMQQGPGQGQGGNGQTFMMPQGGGNLQPGVQYMQMVLPVEQARMMNGVVTMGRIPQGGAPMQMMQQQGGKGGKGGQGFAMQAPAMQNWGNQTKGFKGGFNGFNNGGGKGKGEADDGQLDDWLARRMQKPGSASSTPASDSNSQKMKPEPQMRQGPPQQRHAQMQQQPQQAPFGGPQQMQAWQLPSPQLQQQLAQQHEVQQQQQQLWMQQQQQWQWPQQNMGMQNGMDGYSGGGGGGDSPRTAEWRRKIAESISANPAGENDVNDWISKRSEALADGPARRAPAAQTSMPAIEEDDSPHHPSVPWEAVAPLFENTKPWADVTDADEKKTQDELLQIIQREEERKMQADEAVEESTDQPASVEADTSPLEATKATEPEQMPEAPAPPAKETPPAVPEPARSYAAAAKQTPKAAAKKAPEPVASAPAPKVEAARSNAPLEASPTEPAEVLQKPSQDTPGSTAAEEAPQASGKSDVEKRKKALEKKLRQITDLEKKRDAGTTLSAEESKKVATKAALEDELKQL